MGRNKLRPYRASVNHNMNQTPKQLGYRMPAEWEPHAGTWLAWPHNPETWPGKIKKIPPVWLNMIKPLHIHEQVNLLVNDQATLEQVRIQLRRWDIESNIVFHLIPNDDCWMRDAGPIFVKRDSVGADPRVCPNRGRQDEGAHMGAPLQQAMVKWTFNKWGGKYPPWDLDDAIPGKINETLKLPYFAPGIVMEGGSIDVNGQGTLLTTEQCLLNKNRNPHLSREQIEDYLKNYLGVTKIIWLGEGIVGDDTDGHVDDLTRFVAPRTVVTVVEEDPADENFRMLQDNLRRLQLATDQDGRKLEVVTIPMPGPVTYDGQRLPASYANFYIANGVVLVPTYSHKNDQRALATLQKLFPKRRVVGIECTDMVWGLGAIHCVTQQQPA